MNSSLLHPRQELVETLLRIYQCKMTTTSGGNLSIRDADGHTWITPARLDKGCLRQEDIVCIRADGSTDGLHPPSSEYPFHLEVYALRPDVRAIVHAHPVALVAHSVAHRLPDLTQLPMARNICGRVGLARYAMPGSKELGASIATVFAQGANCVVMENHGVVIGGTSLADAFGRFETLETCAAIAIAASRLGPAHSLTPQQIALANRHEPAIGDLPVELSASEEQIVDDLCRFIRRGYSQRLFTSKQGSFSARTDAESFVINCRRVDRKTIDPGGIALMRSARCESGKQPTSAAAIHDAIYRRHEHARAVILATPVHATAFAIAAANLATRALPESYLFLKDMARIPFEQFASSPQAVAEVLSPQQPAALIEHEGVAVVGKSILDAFDRLEVLENTAQALFLSRQMGRSFTIPDQDIELLTQKFQI